MLQREWVANIEWAELLYCYRESNFYIESVWLTERWAELSLQRQWLANRERVELLLQSEWEAKTEWAELLLQREYEWLIESEQSYCYRDSE